MTERSLIRIRDAEAGDCTALQAVTLAAYEQYATIMPPGAWERFQANILAMFAEPGVGERIVAEQDGTIVGSVVLLPATGARPPGDPGPDQAQAASAPEVRLLAVAPGARGQGIGTVLMRECLRRARQAGATAVQLHTADIMPVAVQMYERMGFRRAPELDWLPTPGVLRKGYRRGLEDIG